MFSGKSDWKYMLHLIMLIPFIVKVKPVFNSVIWISMIKYSFPLLIAGLSGSINDAIDKVLLKKD